MGTRQADGLWWQARGGVSDDHLAYEDHEPFLTALFGRAWQRCVERDEVFLDVGAHVGRYTLRAAARGIPVIAVEPNPTALDGLRANLRLNRGALAGVVILPIAAADALGVARPFARPKALGAGSSRLLSGPDDPADFVDHRTVPAAPLDDLVFAPVGLVKIDVEGAEAEVLLGMRRLLEARRPTLLIELHHRAYGEAILASVAAALRVSRYRVTPVGDELAARRGESRYIFAEAVA